MALSPEQFEVQEFTVAFRGWKKEEVTAFLKRAATEMRELQAQLDVAKADAVEAKRSKEAAIAAAAQLPVPPALAPVEEHDDADKFNELGDRIASLLRTAEESAEKIKVEAEEEAADVRRVGHAAARAASRQRGVEDLLRQPQQKRLAWRDLLSLHRALATGWDPLSGD